MFPALCLCWGQNTRISSEVSFPLGIIRWTPYSKEKSDDSDENTLIRATWITWRAITLETEQPEEPKLEEP